VVEADRPVVTEDRHAFRPRSGRFPKPVNHPGCWIHLLEIRLAPRFLRGCVLAGDKTLDGASCQTMLAESTG